jgi:WD40 repeat protein
MTSSNRRAAPAACLALAVLAAAGQAAAPPASFRPRRLGSHPGGAASLHFSPDGRLLASGGGGKVRLWEVASGKEVRALAGSACFTCAVRFSPDGKVLASGGYERREDFGDEAGPPPPIYRWDVATGKALPPLPGHPGGVRCLAFTPDGKHLISGGFDGAVRFWGLTTGRETRALRGAHKGPLADLALAPDGRLLATAGERTVALWEVRSGREFRRGGLRRVPGRACAFSHDGRLLASGQGEAVRLWELAGVSQAARLFP